MCDNGSTSATACEQELDSRNSQQKSVEAGVLTPKRRRRACGANLLAKKIALEEKTVKVRFTGDKKIYSIQWTELLTPAELPFSSVEELAPGTAVLAPYTDDAPGNIQHSPAVIAGKVLRKASTKPVQKKAKQKSPTKKPKSKNQLMEQTNVSLSQALLKALGIDQSSKSESTPLNPSQSTSTAPMEVPSHSTSTEPIKDSSHSTSTEPIKDSSHSTSTEPIKDSSHSTSTVLVEVTSQSTFPVPMKVSSHSMSTAPMEVPSHSISTAPMEVPSRSISTAPMEVPSRSISTAPMEVPSHSISTAPMEVLSHSISTAPMEVPSHSTFTASMEHLSHSAPVEPLCATANVLENPESVVHLRDTSSHLADSEVAMYSAVPSSHATKSAIPLQHTVLPYRPPVEPHHPSSMPYRFNPTSSHYNEPFYSDWDMPSCLSPSQSRHLSFSRGGTVDDDNLSWRSSSSSQAPMAHSDHELHTMLSHMQAQLNRMEVKFDKLLSKSRKKHLESESPLENQRSPGFSPSPVYNMSPEPVSPFMAADMPGSSVSAGTRSASVLGGLQPQGSVSVSTAPSLQRSASVPREVQPQAKGCYLGFPNKPDWRVWVEGLLPRQLQEIEMNSTDETELARQIFIKLFARELEEKPNEIYCTEVDGKELLNQSWIRGIRFHIRYRYHQSAPMFNKEEKTAWRIILGKLNDRVRYARRVFAKTV